jgi:pimeloyl-ACP methyl ester carboxylesterase
MATFRAADGTGLAYRVTGSGAPVICVPGGPMRASAYLGDLGDLSARNQLVMLDLRGTGQSATPDDPASYRCDRLSGDVEALATTSASTPSACWGTQPVPASPCSTRPPTRTGSAISR